MTKPANTDWKKLSRQELNARIAEAPAAIFAELKERNERVAAGMAAIKAMQERKSV